MATRTYYGGRTEVKRWYPGAAKGSGAIPPKTTTEDLLVEGLKLFVHLLVTEKRSRFD